MKTKTFSLRENEYRIKNVYTVAIDSDLISILRQSRSSMSTNGIGELISSFKSKGQKTPGDIFAFTKDEAVNYVLEMNSLWNTNYKLENFQSFYIKEKENHFYLFLVAGHRRLRAARELKTFYVANIHFEKSFEEAIEWQLAENVQREELPLLDLITSATAYWVKLKKKDPKLTLTSFAKKHIHKSVSWLSSALRFSRLPIPIQDLVRKTEINKGVNYGIMLELAKLYDFSVEKGKPLEEKILLAYVNHTVSHKYNLQKVKGFCELRKSEIIGQQDLFALEIEEVNKNSLTAIRRHKTLHMSEAKSYLKSGEVIARQITENCKTKAEDVLELGFKLEEILTSG